MNSKFESLKQKNAAAIQQMEKATNLTIVDTKMWEKMIELQQTQSDQLTAIYYVVLDKAEIKQAEHIGQLIDLSSFDFPGFDIGLDKVTQTQIIQDPAEFPAADTDLFHDLITGHACHF